MNLCASATYSVNVEKLKSRNVQIRNV